MAMKKAYFFSLDSFLGLMIFTLGVVLMFQFYVSAPELDQPFFYSDDLTAIFSSVKIKDLSEMGIIIPAGKEEYTINDIMAEKIADNIYTDLEKGDVKLILDQIFMTIKPKKYQISIYITDNTNNFLIYGEDPANAKFLTTKTSLINVNNEFKKYMVKVWL